MCSALHGRDMAQIYFSTRNECSRVACNWGEAVVCADDAIGRPS